MRSKRNAGVHVCALMSLLVVVMAALMATSALALPEGRVYEQVSPQFKGGYGAAGILGVEPGGENVAYDSAGVFAGSAADHGFAYYQAARSGSGWSTVSLTPSANIVPLSSLIGFSPSLGASLWELTVGGKNTRDDTSEVQFAEHAPGAPVTQTGFQAVGPVMKSLTGEPLGAEIFTEGFSTDLCHVVVSPAFPVVGEGGDNNYQLYDLSAGCHGEPSYQRVVGLNSAGGLLSDVCDTQLAGLGRTASFRAVSGDGSEIFFQVVPGTEISKCLNGHGQLFVRVGGVRTLEVSKPLGECAGGEVPCDGGVSRPAAKFWGASEDGSRVFFTTAARLDPASDLDSGSDLYMAKIGCRGEGAGCEAGQRVVTGLVQVSHDQNVGQAAEVQGVVGVAPDGSRVYFVARGVLSGAANGQGLAAREGADNLYVYDSLTGETVFVGDLCSGPELSGVAVSVACPVDLDGESGTASPRNDTNLWLHFPGSSAQTAGGDGRFLVFSSYARLIVSGPEADADDAQDVYRYDAQTGGLQRVSLGEAGADANGNANDEGSVGGQAGQEGVRSADALIQRDVKGVLPQEERDGARRAISEDGSRVVFVSAEPLSVQAINGVENVYEWHDGVVSMVSCGCATEPDHEPVITPSGRDIFFNTTVGLVPGDTDGAPDIYDARLGGGFAPVPAVQEECSADACQGPLTNPVPLLVPGSAVQAPGGSLAAPVAPAAVAKPKPKPKAKVKSVVCGKSYVKRKDRCVKRSRLGKALHAAKSSKGSK